MTTTITRVARRATRTNNSCTPTNTEQRRTSRRVYLFDFFLALHGETIPVSHRAYTHPATLRLFSVISFCSSYDTRHYSLFLF